MATDDRFKQYSEAGEEFLEAARSRAVEFLKELARVGQTTQKQAQDQVDEMVDAGRRSTDVILEVIRKEIASQLGQLGLATKDDLADLERRLTRPATASTAATAGAPATASTAATAGAPATASAPATAGAAAEAGAPTKKAPAKKAAADKAAGQTAKASAPAKKAPAKKAPAKKATAKKAAAPHQPGA